MARVNADLIAEAAGLWSGSGSEDFEANPEYLRGQVELILNVSQYDDSDDHDTLKASLSDLIKRLALLDPGAWRENVKTVSERNAVVVDFVRVP